MEPNLLPPKEPPKFRSEAEYRRWQSEIAAEFRQLEQSKGLVTRIVNSVFGWLS